MLAFVSTNVDDIFILMLFFGTKRYKRGTIIAGQYLGMAGLVGLALVFSYFGQFIDQRYIGLLGLFPIYLATTQVIALLKGSQDSDVNATTLTATGVFAIAGITIANGGDNVGVYVPLFAIMSDIEKIQMIVVFAIMTFFWCLAGEYLASHPVIAKQIDKSGHVLMPIVLFLLGIFILIESGTFQLLN